MRRLPRWAFNGLCLLSLLACLGACVLWVESYGWWLAWTHGGPAHGGAVVFVDSGAVYAGGYPRPTGTRHTGAARGGSGRYDPTGGRAADSIESTAGLTANRVIPVRVFTPGPSFHGLRLIVVPVWAFALIAALPPAAWLRGRIRRHRRRRRGLCPRCGYDLTGNTSGRCSECGEVVRAERRVTA